MRKPAFVAALFVSLNCFGSIALVQSTLGGAFSGNLTGAHQVMTTSAVGFGSNTTSGNTLLCVIWVTAHGTGASGDFQNVTVTTTGLTWTGGIASPTYLTASPRSTGMTIIARVASTPVTSATTVVSIDSGSSSGTNAYALEFALFEFSGLGLLDVTATPSNHSGGTPGATVTTTATDLILVSLIADNTSGTNISNGFGYALGPNAVVATVGQVQYQMNVPAGSNAALFSGTEPSWGALVATYKAIVTGASVPRHKGYVF